MWPINSRSCHQNSPAMMNWISERWAEGNPSFLMFWWNNKAANEDTSLTKCVLWYTLILITSIPCRPLLFWQVQKQGGLTPTSYFWSPLLSASGLLYMDFSGAIGQNMPASTWSHSRAKVQNRIQQIWWFVDATKINKRRCQNAQTFKLCFVIPTAQWHPSFIQLQSIAPQG